MISYGHGVEESLPHKYKSTTAKNEPLLRWKYNEEKYLAVSRVTTKYLSVVATSVAYEQSWSSCYQERKSVITRRQRPRPTGATRF